ncbi:MAG: sulfotransferase family protein [Methylacidiphilales bacterium]|nr:sulfotransferase family protein [Candidatus Methylacidiphilales bacterium]
MAYLLNNGAVFLHVPKTGGTWIKHVLEEMNLVRAPLGHQHSDWERSFWHDKLHRDLKVVRYIFRRAVRSPRAQARINPDCFKFCFVREPILWYESYWRFMESQNWSWKTWGDERDPYKWHPCAMLNGLDSPDFNEFMYNVNRKRPGFVTEMYGWYVRPGIGFVGKTESLWKDLIEVLSLMKLDVDVNKILSMSVKNESPSHIPRPEWDPALKKATLRLEHAGYVRFGYPIEGARMTSASKNRHQAEMSQVL